MEVWSTTVARQVDRMRIEMVTMQNGLISTNNSIARNMNTFRKVVSDLLTNAARILSSVEYTTVQIPPAPVFPSPSLYVPETPLSGPGQPPPPMQPQRQSLLPDQQQPPISTQSKIPEHRSPTSPPPSSSPPFSPPPSSSPPLSFPPLSPLPSSPLPSSPPPSTSPRLSPQLQPPSVKVLPIFQPVSHDLEALADQLAWPRDRPTTSSYTMKKRPRVIDAVYQEWFHGVDGEPSIWQMNKYYKWRKNASAAVRKHHSINRLIIESVLRANSEAQGASLELRAQAGLLVVKERIARAGFLSQYYKQLQSRRTTAEKVQSD